MSLVFRGLRSARRLCWRVGVEKLPQFSDELAHPLSSSRVFNYNFREPGGAVVGVEVVDLTWARYDNLDEPFGKLGRQPFPTLLECWLDSPCGQGSSTRLCHTPIFTEEATGLDA